MRALLCAALAAVFTFCACADSVRETLCLDGDWQNAAAAVPDRRPEHWKAVKVPDLRMDRRTSPAEWYERDFSLKSIDPARRYLLRFEQVNHLSHIVLNGHPVLTHLGGYIPFDADVTAYVKPGVNHLLVVAENVQALDMKQVRENASLPPELRSDITLAVDIPERERCVPVSPQGNRMSNWGILGHVALEIVPDVRIDDCFVKPDVRRGTVGVELELVNAGSRAFRGAVGGEIPLEDGKRIILPQKPVRLEPGERGLVTFEDLPAAGLKLWWPRTFRPAELGDAPPALYRAEIRLDDAAGTLRDHISQRFGYRQLWTEGERFVFNGLPIRLMGTSAHFGEGGMDPAAFYDKVEASGANIVRLHLQPRSRDWYDLADERGVLMVGETAVGLPNGVRSNNPVFWKNCAVHIERFLKARRNNPSVVMWSIENEMGLNGNGKVTDAEVRKLYEHALTFDRTRPIEAEGDTDMDVMPVVNVHCWWDYDKAMFPENFYWRERGRCFPNYRTFKDVPYFGKPLYVGEFSTEWSDGPEDYRGEPAIVMGEAAYAAARDDRFKLRGEITRRQIEAFRQQDIAGMAPFTMFETRTVIPGPYSEQQKKGFRPVALLMRESGGRFYSGSRVTRTLSILNDSADSRSLHLAWKAAAADGKTVASGDEPAELAPGKRKTVKIAFPAPATGRKEKLAFTAFLKDREGRMVDSVKADYAVFSATPPRVDARGTRLLCFGADSGTMNAVRAVYRDVVPVSSIPAFSGKERLLLVAPDAMRQMKDSEREKLWRFVRDGGVAVILWQPAGVLPGLADGPAKPHSINFVNLPGHPVWSYDFPLTDGDLRWWNGGPTAERMFRKPAAGDCRILTGGGFDLECTSLVEFREGKGMWLACSLPLVSRFGLEPVARELLYRLLRYGAEYAPGDSPRVDAAVFGDVSSLASALEGREYRTLDAAGLSVGHLPGLVITTGKALAEASPAERAGLSRFVAGGGTVYLCGLSASDSGAILDFLPRGERREFNGIQVQVKGKPELFRGLTAADFYWCSDYHRVKNTSRRIGKAQVEFKGGEALTEPALFSVIPRGKGRVIVDLIDWPGTDSEKARRIGNTLLNNLGIPRKRTSNREIAVDYRFVDLDPYVNRTFRDRKSGDGDNGWTDQGENDLRNFPAGEQTFNGIPFRISAGNGGMAAMVSADPKPVPGLPGEIGPIPARFRADRLYFLHGAAWAHGDGGWEYMIHYDGGTSAVVKVKNNVQVADWWSDSTVLPGARIAWSGSNPVHPVSIYMQEWSNPYPAREIRSIRIRGGSPVAFVLAVTGVKEK